MLALKGALTGEVKPPSTAIHRTLLSLTSRITLTLPKIKNQLTSHILRTGTIKLISTTPWPPTRVREAFTGEVPKTGKGLKTSRGGSSGRLKDPKKGD